MAGAGKVGAVIARFADPAQLAVAFARLNGGASLVYATGPASLGGVRNPTIELVQGWVKAGTATLAQGRDAGNRDQFNYRVYRKSVPAVPAPAPAPAAMPAALRELPVDAQRVYRLLAGVAAAGRACPTNDAIADLLDLEGREQARHRFNQLVRAGLIAVIEPNRFGTRVIRIAATGHRTAPADAGAAGAANPIHRKD